MLKNIVFSIVFGCFRFCVIHPMSPCIQNWTLKNFGKTTDLRLIFPISLGTWGTLSPLLTPVMAQHNNQTPNTHQRD